MDQTEIFQNEYGRYSVPDGLDARPAVRLVKAGDVYEPGTIAFMREHAGSGDIIHAGTFFGDFLPGLSSAMAPDARIWAFEPNPASHRHARETIALNDLSNVTLTNAALSDRNGAIHFRTHKEDGEALGGHSHFVEGPGAGVEKVEALMLDFVVPLERPVSILQLDVEGHEGEALLGAYHIINRWKPIIILEEFDRPRWLKRNFPRVNYDRVSRIHGNLVYLPEGRSI
ncbi:FkbM family methyltransferase [Maritimibacter sp. DP1N21-5]|uniref:FkbM family methyltransferase n=1 Tax=Maritimibacter sp. DP1N21-5 TaxID=2836867 RepID=UPI001C471866|nr:FkbM family methyltransferase [Maritimibacter sp. DP1N21-5]MBV7410970.1 FkbM family methyltransferase [Maritimibacter sp. DP1N21-5]